MTYIDKALNWPTIKSDNGEASLVWPLQGRHSPYAEYAERVGPQVPGGGPQNYV